MTKKDPPPAVSWEDALLGRLVAFVDIWRNFEGNEQAGAQSFLNSLLDIYDVSFRPGTIFEQHPIKIPARGKAVQTSLFGGPQAAAYTTERMDMYLPKVCVWEMKAPAEQDLQRHHDQLLRYWSRVRTRYMVLCNFQEFWVYDTNDEHGQLEPKLKFTLDQLPEHGAALLFLRGEEPDLLGRAERVTSDVARMLGRLMRDVVASSTDQTRARDQIAKVVLECVFAMFAEDTELIPAGLFAQAMKKADESGDMSVVWALFDDFGNKIPGQRKNTLAPYVNGPLFDRKQPRPLLSAEQIRDLHVAARDFQWDGVRPEIFGSIFEQALDPIERHELGAHFTREADIARVIGPTLVIPWQERIEAIRTPKDAARVVDEMRAFHVLDPACGCGNFLYVAYREMKRLEVALARKWTAVHRFIAKRKADIPPPPAGPWFTLGQVHGIELNAFAAFLARVVLWIGEHLASRELGLDDDTLPLKNLDKTVRNGDALFTDWPRPDGELAIVGNPPYLGGRKLRHELGEAYTEKLFAAYPGDASADYVTYWFACALKVLRPRERAGFVCTNSIAQNESREASIDKVLAKGGTITDAWRSYPWPGEAAVHIAIVNWLMAEYGGIRTLDGSEVSTISPALTEAVDTTTAATLHANTGLCFQGVTPRTREFVLSREQRKEILAEDPASKAVVRPFLIGLDVNRDVQQRPGRWIVDFGVMSKAEAQVFVGAFKYVQRHVYPKRMQHKDAADFEQWWQLWRPRPALREAIGGMKRVIVIPRVSPHLTMCVQPATTCFDNQLLVVALSDPYHFGLLQSRVHAIWARTRGSTLKGDLRYTNTTIFETFPFPLLASGSYDPRVRPPGKKADRLAKAAETFDQLRLEACRDQNVGLTKIHNQLAAGTASPLRESYDALNDAVAACYGWPDATWRDEGETLRRLILLNQEVAALPPG